MIRSILTALLVFACVTPGFAGEAENILIVKNMVEAINSRDFDALDGLVAADVVRHSAATPGVSVSNISEFKNLLKADLAACPDAKQEVEIIFGSGDMVAVRVRYIGTQTGAMGPFPPSGKRMDLPFMGMLRIAGGKIAEIWVEWDNLNILTQLGHFTPGPARAPEE